MNANRSLHRLLLAIAATVTLVGHAHATRYPLTIQSCNRQVTFERAPQRAVSHDINMTEMMVALGLQSRMAGYTGITGWNKLNAPLKRSLGTLPELAREYPSVETLVGRNVDFLFAGWNYGMRVGGELTPSTLAPLGIQVYELTESCAHIMKRRGTSLDDVYTDLANLGKIFNVEERATSLIAGMKARVADIRQKIVKDPAQPRVFIYDSGEDRPFTAGKLAMPDALLAAAGGRNIMADVNASWTRVNWEAVVERNPEVIVIIDYGNVTADQKRDFLRNNPALNKMDAVKNNRFIVLPYDAATPGLGNVDAIATLAKGLHPKVFP